MNIFTDNAGFYPTKPETIKKMLGKLKRRPKFMLEPSAGKGDIPKFIEQYNEQWHYSRGDMDSRLSSALSIKKIHVIEKDPNLQRILLADKMILVDTDFLTFAGDNKYDAILMNPPFADGDKHLLKAIDIIYNGEIVCLLNAETIRNPYSTSRQYLVEKLESLGAEIEYLEGEFSDAERKTDIDIALIYINIENDIKSILFDGSEDKASVYETGHINENELVEHGTVSDLVARFRLTIESGVKTIMEFYKNHTVLKDYLSLSIANGATTSKPEKLTERVTSEVNEFIDSVRKDFWMSTLNLKEVQERMTEKKRNEFTSELEQRAQMDFTERNIMTFIMNLMNSYKDIVSEAAVQLFDDITKSYAWDANIHEKNRLYWDKWKTNDVFKVGPKVIIPFHSSAFVDSYSNGWRSWLDHSIVRKFDDIDKVMDYFSAGTKTTKLSDVISDGLRSNFTSGLESTHFTVKIHKKGTVHLQFKSNETLASFNRSASMSKNWLPPSYGKTSFDEMSQDDKDIVKAFEGEKSYSKFFKGGSQIMARGKSFLQIAE